MVLEEGNKGLEAGNKGLEADREVDREADIVVVDKGVVDTNRTTFYL
jgi:hypothetical protein